MLYPIRLGDNARELFISVQLPFLKQLVQIYYEHGYVEMLHAIVGRQTFLISNLATLALRTLNTVDNIRIALNPTYKQSKMKIISEAVLTRNWSGATIRCIAWHPDYVRLAVATCDDTVRIFMKSMAPILKCKEQKNVTAIEWRPMSDSEIAVACEQCIIIWNVDPHSVVSFLLIIY